MFPDINPPFTHAERVLVDFSKLKKTTMADFTTFRSRLAVGEHPDRYRAKARQMSDEELKGESHSSRRYLNQC